MEYETRDEWVREYHYRDSDSVNCCDLCAYGDPIDIDGKPGVEALYCMAAAEDTGKICEVDFEGICDLFLSDMIDGDGPDEDFED